MKKHYLYVYTRLDKNEPFYIGIGTKNNDDLKYNTYTRAYSKKANKIWRAIIDKTSYKVEIILESDDHSLIKDKEVQYIKEFGKIYDKTGILANFTDGGEGISGYKFTDEQKKNLSNSHKGLKYPKSAAIKRLMTMQEKDIPIGYRLSDEQKQRLRTYRLGSKQSLEQIEKRISKIKKKIINIETLDIYDSYKEVVHLLSIKPRTFTKKLSGHLKNDTPFVYLENYKKLL